MEAQLPNENNTNHAAAELAQSQVIQGNATGLTNAHLAWSAPTGTHLAPPASRSAAMVLLGALVVLGVIGAVAVGYFVARGEDTAKPAMAKKTLPASSTASSKLVVYASPSGAVLTVNGRMLAQSVGPEGVEVPVESNALLDVQVKRAGYHPAQQRLRLAPGTTQHLNLSLNPLPAGTATASSATASPSTSKSEEQKKPASSRKASKPRRHAAKRRPKAEKKSPPIVATSGTLSLSFTPADAKVYLDNNIRHGGSPLQLGGIAPGRHTLAIQADGYATLTRTLKVRAGEEVVLSLSLNKERANQARLDIVTSPAGAMISINGKEQGTSPLVALMLPPGKQYRFSASLPGYESDSVSVTAKAGRNRPVVLTLKKATVRSQALKIAVSVTNGDAKRGRALFASTCGSCHGKSTKALSSKSRTAAQWSRYLASGRHAYRQPLRGKISVSQLKDIKAYLMSDSADTERAIAAGVR